MDAERIVNIIEKVDSDTGFAKRTIANCVSILPQIDSDQDMPLVRECERSAVAVIKQVMENPQLLLDMPRLSLTSDEKIFFHQDVDFPQLVDESSEEVQRFLKSIGLNTLNQISESTFSKYSFRGLIDFHPRMMSYFSSMFAEKTFSLGFLLLALRCEVVSQQFVDTATTRAINIINSFVPSLEISKKPITLIDPIFSGNCDNAAYYGFTEDITGVISLEAERDPFRSQSALGNSEIMATISAIHELLHFKHDQLIKNQGVENTIGALQQTGLTNIDIGKHSGATFSDIVDQVGFSQSFKEKVERRESQKTLSSWVVEGMAVQLEIFLANELKKIEIPSNPDTSKQVQKYFNTRFSDLRERRSEKSRSYYQGLKMVRLLTKKFSAREISTILKDIQMELCDVTHAYSPLGMIIQADPRFLPGLAEKNQAVRQSLQESNRLPLDLNDMRVADCRSENLLSEEAATNLESIGIQIGSSLVYVTLTPHEKKQDRVSYETVINGSRCLIGIPFARKDHNLSVEDLKKEKSISKLLNASGVAAVKLQHVADGILEGNSYPVVIEMHEDDYHHITLAGKETKLNVERHLTLEDSRNLTQIEFVDNIKHVMDQLYSVLQLGLDLPNDAWTVRIKTGKLELFIQDVSAVTEHSLDSEKVYSLLSTKTKRAWRLFVEALSEEDKDANRAWCNPGFVLQIIDELCYEKKFYNI